MNKKQTMLIADDLVVNRTSIRAMFEEEYDVLEAEDGGQALQILQEKQVDVVVIDLHMPVGQGEDVIGQMKSNPALRNIPVIVKTASEGDAEEKMLELGVDDFIFSPCNPAVMKRRIDNVVQRYGIWKERWRQHRESEEQFGRRLGAYRAGEIRKLRGMLEEIAALCGDGAKEEDCSRQKLDFIGRQAACALKVCGQLTEEPGWLGEESPANKCSFHLYGIAADILREYTAVCWSKDLQFFAEPCREPDVRLYGDAAGIKCIWKSLLEGAYFCTKQGGRIKTGCQAEKLDNGRMEVVIAVESGEAPGAEYRFAGALAESMDGSIAFRRGADGAYVTEVRLPVSVDRAFRHAPRSFKSMRVMVLDDNETTSSYYAAIVSRLGLVCDIAANQTEALCLLGAAYDTKRYYDICILNWNMRGAKELTEVIKNSSVRGNMAIVCATHERARMEPDMRRAGVDYIVEHPLYQATLYEFLSGTFSA